jgi:hypothetical protein
MVLVKPSTRQGNRSDTRDSIWWQKKDAINLHGLVDFEEE